MWTFPGLLFLIYVSAFSALRMVHSMVPWFWEHGTQPIHILIKVRTVPEIDNAIYASAVVLFFILFLVNLGFWSYLRTRFRLAENVFRIVSFAVSLYILIVPLSSVYSIGQIHVPTALTCAILGVLIQAVWGIRTETIERLAALAVLRRGFKMMLTYDIGPNKYVNLFDYLYFCIAGIVLGYGYALQRYVFRSFAFMQALARRLTRKRLLVLCGVLISVSLVYLMAIGHDPIDIYFTFIPAWQFVQGGTPLVSMMSQYGLLYLVPWIAWLYIFPHVPVTFQVGEMIVALLLIFYYWYLLVLSEKLYSHRLVFVLTVCSSYYFTMLVRQYGFPDPVSLVSTPAFTPLRFGIFVFPLSALFRFVRTNRQRDIHMFILLSCILFFYSFEIGAGLMLSAIVTVTAIAWTNRFGWYRWVEYLLRFVFWIAVCLVVFSIFGLLRAGAIPDFPLYAFFSKMYALGYLMLPIDTQTVALLPVGVAIMGLVFGLREAVVKKSPEGYLMIYLACITLVEMPYYMGRSVFPTLYDISLPFVLLCGLFVSFALDTLRANARSATAWLIAAVCGFVLVIGGIRAIVITGNSLLHAAEIAETSSAFVSKAMTAWDIKNNKAYLFLRKRLPDGCPIIIFDQNEFGLLPAMNAKPAFQYAFVRGFVTSQEQVDAFVPLAGASRVCVFTSRQFLDFQDDLSIGVYRYFWERFGPQARLIATDETNGYSLYEIPTGAFVARKQNH